MKWVKFTHNVFFFFFDGQECPDHALMHISTIFQPDLLKGISFTSELGDDLMLLISSTK